MCVSEREREREREGEGEREREREKEILHMPQFGNCSRREIQVGLLK